MKQSSLLVLLLCSHAVFASEPMAENKGYEYLSDRLLNGKLTPFDENYVVYSYFNKNTSFDSDKLLPHEIKAQISYALPLIPRIAGSNSSIAAAYTQQSYFQIANKKQSSPIRESNYNLYFFWVWDKDIELPLGFKTQDFEIGYHHQSNGQGLLLTDHSRSWDRVYMRFGFTKGNFYSKIRFWINTNLTGKYDNPDIINYKSIGDITFAYHYDKHQVKLRGYYNPHSSKGGAEIAYKYQLSPWVGLYAQGFAGYGENLVDYNKQTFRLSLGLAFSDLF